MESLAQVKLGKVTQLNLTSGQAAQPWPLSFCVFKSNKKFINPLIYSQIYYSMGAGCNTKAIVQFWDLDGYLC